MYRWEESSLELESLCFLKSAVFWDVTQCDVIEVY
jgi:hypothetical protein